MKRNSITRRGFPSRYPQTWNYGYTTQPVVAPNGAGNAGLLQPNGDGFSVLGQAWARGRAGPATATLFRQALQLPFINGNDSRMIPNTFETYQIEVEPWPVFRLNCGYVAGMKARRTSKSAAMSNSSTNVVPVEQLNSAFRQPAEVR